MGSGAARPVTSEIEGKPLSEEANAKLGAALQKLDRMDPKFKEKRDDERTAQMSKAWSRLCTEIDGHLRGIAKEFHASQQLSLDIASEGGGATQRPFLEEMTGAFDRMYVRLDGTEAVVTFKDKTLGRIDASKVTYEWLEQMAVEWVVTAVAAKG